MNSSKFPLISRYRIHQGLSLLETAVATLLVAMTLVVSLNTLAFVMRTTQHDAEAQRSTQIAQVLLSEICSRPFSDPDNATTLLGLESGDAETRGLWDDCDDYHDWSTSTILTAADQPLSDAEGWQAQVNVTYCDPNDPSMTAVVPTTLKCIALTLVSPAGRTFGYSSLRCDHGVLLTAQPTGSQVLTNVDILLQGDGAASTAGTRCHNQQEAN